MAHGRLIYPPSGGGGGAADGVNIIAAGSQTANSTGTVVFSNSNGVSFGMSNNSVVTASVAGAAAGSISAGTTRAILGELAFSNSNGLSFGISGQTITGSYTVPSTAGLISALNISAGTTSNNSSAVRFQDSNGVSFGLNAGTVTATVRTDYLTSQSNQAFSASGGSSTFQTLSFTNSNGFSFSNTNGSIVGSYTVPNTAGLISAINVSAGTTSNNASAVVFSNANGVSFGLSGSTVTGSHNGLTSQSNQAFSASGGSSTFQTLNFANSNGFTFSNSNGSVIGSYTVPSVPTQTNQTLGLYAVSNTTGASSSSTVDARSLSFQGAGVASVGMTNGSVVISVPSGGGAGDGVNILAAGTQTANTTGTVVFSNSNGVTFGMSNNSVITASVAGGGGGGVAISAGANSVSNGTVVFSNSNNLTFGLNGSTVTGSYSQTVPSISWLEPRPIVGVGVMVASSLLLQRFSVDANISATVCDIIGAISGSASAGGTLTYTAGLYGFNGSTLSSLSSGSRTIGFNSTAAASSYTALSATRYHSIPVTFNLTPGEYMMGFIFNSTSSATVGTYSYAVNNSQLTIQQEPFAAGNRTRNVGVGVYSAATTALPSTIHITQVVQTSNVAIRPPWFALAGTF